MKTASTSGESKIADPVRLAVIQNAVVGIAREMGTIMERASYSAILNEGKDFSCAVFNRDGELVAEGEFVLVHLAAMHEAVQVLIRKFESAGDPATSRFTTIHMTAGSHLPDINIVRPVFAGDEIAAYVAVRAHYPDVGGIVPGSFSGEAQNLFSEGVVIPPLLLVRQDRLAGVAPEHYATRNQSIDRQTRRPHGPGCGRCASARSHSSASSTVTSHQVLGEVLDEIPRHGEEIMQIGRAHV